MAWGAYETLYKRLMNINKDGCWPWGMDFGLDSDGCMRDTPTGTPLVCSIFPIRDFKMLHFTNSSETRMHSSRVRTARSSCRPRGSPPGPPRSRHAPGRKHNHRRLWKYNLAPTSLRAVTTKIVVKPEDSSCWRKTVQYPQQLPPNSDIPLNHFFQMERFYLIRWIG